MTTTDLLTIVVYARPVEGTAEFVYHAQFKEQCGISHWHSAGETVLRKVVDRAREVATEAGYTTREDYEIIEQ